MTNCKFIDTIGKKRIGIIVNCANCNKEIFSRKDQIRKYCSKQCCSLASQKRILVTCKVCKKKLYKVQSKLKNSKSKIYFCSRNCKEKAQTIEYGLKEIQPNHYKNGAYIRYRQKALARKKACERCGFSNMEILQVHHKDKDRTNNLLENLEVLCPNCHALVHFQKESL